MPKNCQCPKDGSYYCARCLALAKMAGLVLEDSTKHSKDAIIKKEKARHPSIAVQRMALTKEPVIETQVATKKSTTAPSRLARLPLQSLEERLHQKKYISDLKTIPPEPAFNLQTYPVRVSKNNIITHCVLPGNPGIKQRPRFYKKGGTVYTPKPTKESQREIGWAMRASMRELLINEYEAFGIRIIFYVEGERKKDIDNMIKLVFDGVTGTVWGDDSQVKEVMSWVVIDEVHPRTEILIYKLGYNAREYRRCLVCGVPFRTHPSWLTKRYCLQQCSGLAQRNRIILKCAYCGAEMERVSSISNMYNEYFCNLEHKRLHHSVTLTCDFCKKSYVGGKAR